MSTSLDALLVEESKLTRALEQARATCRRCAGDERRDVIAHRSNWMLDSTIKNTVLIIYILCDFEELPVAVYLRSVGTSRHWPAMPDSELLKLAQDCFTAADLSELVLLTAVDEPSDAIAMRVAMKTVQEWRLVRWGLDLNANGVAPSTCDLLRQAGDFLPVSARGKTKTGRPARSARTWASRCFLILEIVTAVGFGFHLGFGGGGTRVSGV